MKIACAAVVKNESRYIAEWISYYISLGFDAVIIIDNMSTDNTVDIAKKYQSTFDVRIITSEDILESYQKTAYMRAVEIFKYEFEWIAFFDADEFLVLSNNMNIKNCLELNEAASGIGINWKIFGSSGHKEPQKGLLIEKYLLASDANFGPNAHVKSIVRPLHVDGFLNGHVFAVKGPYKNLVGQDISWLSPGIISGKPNYAGGQLNHYFTKSYDDWIIKVSRGYPDLERKIAEFDIYDRNEIFDDCALKYREGTLMNLSRAADKEPPNDKPSQVALLDKDQRIDTTSVVAFRTHVWDSDVETLARRAYGSSAGLKFVVLADETTQQIDVPFWYQKLAHTDNFDDLGLPNYPQGRSLWYNADYPLYRLRSAYPDARYYIMVEFDVAINIALCKLETEIFDKGIDLVVSDLREVGPDWPWFKTVNRYFDKVFQAFIPFILISGRAIDEFLKIRQHIAMKNKSIVSEDDWPFCEAFIGSAFSNISHFAFARLSEFAELPVFNAGPPLSVATPLSDRPNTLVHPVLAGDRLIKKLLMRPFVLELVGDNVSVFEEISDIERTDLIKHTELVYRSRGDVGRLRKLKDIASKYELNILETDENIAYGRPAEQSSISRWSTYKDVFQEARLGNGERPNDELYFHTEFELNPWWQCDFCSVFLVSRVILFNRLAVPDRCVQFAILSSEDGELWRLEATKISDTVFGGADGNPYIFLFDPSFRSRYVRVQLIGEGFLHLDQVEIFGTKNRG